VAESTLTDVFGAMEGMGGKDDVLAILESAKGGELQGEDGWLEGGAPV
jgi:hypothetical protein